VRGAFLLSLVFYKICTKIIHKVYVELRSGLVCMECKELHHNRHTVSLLADRMIISPKVNRTLKRYVQALHSIIFSQSSGVNNKVGAVSCLF